MEEVRRWDTRRYCWLTPGDVFDGTRVAPRGGFVFLFHDINVRPKMQRAMMRGATRNMQDATRTM